MSGRLRNIALIGIGCVAGVAASLGISAYAFRDSRGPIPLEEIRQFSEVFGAIKANYVEPVDDRKLIQEAISGMLSGLDPHSSFLDTDAFKDLQAGTQGEFGGLGIEVGTEEGAIRVIAPIDDTPAARAGIRSGDLIIKIDDKLTRGMALPEAVKLMRGKPKTPIVLTVVRKGESQPLEVRLVRDVIKVQSVRARVIEPGYGFIRISQFQERTVEDLVKAINDLQRQGATKGLVLDLRNNPGGLLHSSVGMSAAFLQPRALVTSTDGRNEDSRRRFVAAPEDYQRGRGEDILSRLPREAKTVPMVVLVNNASASASEIVAGALQDHKRAVVMGTQTFGKGSVQTIIPIRAEGNTPAAIKLTTARYYTPSGRSIQAKGIVPDLLVEDTPEAPCDMTRAAAAARVVSAPTMPDLDDRLLQRYSRHILLNEIGIEGQARIGRSRMLVIGAGGLGSPAAYYLASAGVGRITLVDGDSVDLTNLQRQILHTTERIGQPKAESGRLALAAINPEVEVVARVQRADAAQLRALVAEHDVVLDCSDNFATRHAVNRACVEQRRPLVSGAAIRFDGQLAVFDLRQPEAPCYACLFPAGEGQDELCAVMGVFAPLTGIVGTLQAAEALKLAAGEAAAIGASMSGRLLMIEALGMTLRTVRVPRDPHCEVCAAAGAAA